MSLSNPFTPHPNGDSAAEFSLQEFVYTYVLRYWYLYVFFVGLGIGSAWLRIRYATPVYQQRSTLLIKDEYTKSSAVNEEAIFRDLGLIQGGPRLLNETQILKSRPIMADVVRKLGLDVEYYVKGRVRISEVYPVGALKATLYEVSENGYDVPFEITVLNVQRFRLKRGVKISEHAFGEILELPEGKFIFTLATDNLPIKEFRVIFRRPDDAAAGYVGSLNIALTNNYSSVLEMTFKSPIPKKGVDILNTLVEVYNQVTIEDKNRVGRNTIQFIDDRLKYLTRELADVEGNLEQFKKTNEIPTEINSSVDNLLDQLLGNDQEMTRLEVQKSIMEGLEAYLQDQLTLLEPAPVNLLPENPQIAGLVSRYNDLLLERNRLSQAITPENPSLKNLNAQVEVFRQSILTTLRNNRQEIELTLNKARNQNQRYQSKIRTFPTKERGLIEIKRQQSIKESLFLYLLQKREETSLSLAIAVPNSRVVDPALNSGIPISPNKRSIYLLSLLVGLLIPSGLIYLRYLLTNTVQSEADISAQTAVPLLGTIAYKKVADPVVVQANSRSAMAEMFRLMRTNLQFLTGGKNNQVILITSSSSGEGKSFVTLNLGITLALAEKKTIILELDLRKPKLIRYLTKQPAENGITHYLIGQLEVEQIVQQSTLQPNLYYIASGPIPPNPAELLLTDRLKNLIERLRQDFDYVLLDTPPVGMVADALLLGERADCSLYVVRHGHTQKSTLQLIQELYVEKKLPQLALVYNGVKSGNRYGYGKGYGYGYGYGYHYGYYDEGKTRKKWWEIWKKG